MFDVKIDSSSRKALLTLELAQKSTVRGIRQAFYFLGKDLKADANKNILAKPRSGRVYKHKGRRHTASTEGESFANRSGAARRTLGFDVKGGDQLEFGFREKAATIYTKFLEESLNRPTLGIAVKDNQRNAQVHFEREIKKAIEEGYK